MGGSVDIDPAICSGHLTDPWKQRWREGRVGSWIQGVEGLEGRGG